MKQIILFVIVGGAAALTHAIALLTAVECFSMSTLWGNVFGFACAFVVSFIGHVNLTFQSHTTQSTHALVTNLIRWLSVSILGFALNQFLFYKGIMWFSDEYYLIIWFVVTAIVTIVSFILGKLWAFRQGT